MTGPPHPRAAVRVLGHDMARGVFARAAADGRMPHAWLLTGPEGIGKATFAYIAAKGLLAGDGPTEAFSVDSSSFAASTVAAGAHPDMLTLDRDDVDAKRKKTEISVDEARRVPTFLSKTSTLGGRRIVLIDGADSMNRNAANAILKTLEQPPAGVVFLLVAHRAGWLPDTIPSRCRRLALRPPNLDEAREILRTALPCSKPADRDAALALTDAHPGEAVRLLADDGMALYRRVAGLVEQGPDLDLRAAHALAEEVGRAGAEEAFSRFDRCLTGLARQAVRAAAALGKGDRAGPAAAKLAGAGTAEGLIDALDGLSELFRRAHGVNMDRRQTALQAMLLLRDAVRAK